MEKTVRIVQDVTVENARGVTMFAILVDCQGNRQVMPIGPSEVIDASDYFMACGLCGVGVLETQWIGDGCAKCYITGEWEVMTRKHAEDFFKACVMLFGADKWHIDYTPDNYCFPYTRHQILNAEEQAVYDKNLTLAIAQFEGECAYTWAALNVMGMTPEELV